MNSIIQYDLLQTDGEHFLQTHVTNPLLTERTIQDALETYFKQLPKHDSLLSVNSIKKRAYNEKIEPINHRHEQLLMTQDLPEILIENSNIFLFSRSSFYANNNSRIGKNPFAYKMNELEAIDIDTLEEFQLAELIHSRRELFGFIDE